jgi:hypothetical protein
MANRTKGLVIAAALAAFASLPAHAQSLATYGSAEAAGYGEGSLFLGSTLSLPGGQGWSPLVSAYVQTYRYRSGVNSHATATAFAPAVGLSYGMPTGNVSASVGYNFTSTDVSNVPIVGLQGGNTSSVFTTLQANHWGDGNHAVQGIVSYAWRSQYVWSRLRAAQRSARASCSPAARSSGRERARARSIPTGTRSAPPSNTASRRPSGSAARRDTRAATTASPVPATRRSTSSC